MSELGAHHAFFAGLVKRPVLLLTMLATSVVVGLISYARIPIQMMPDGIVEPGLQVFVTNPGASAQENEEQVARVLESELRTLAGVENIESTSSQDRVMVFVEFKASTDMNYAKAEVRDRVERSRAQLPTSVQEVGIWSWSQSDLPVMFFAMLHPGGSRRTDFLVHDVIQRRLEAVDGVGRVEMWGLQDDSLRILLDEDRVSAANLDLGTLIRRLSKDNFALPLGNVEDGGTRLILRSDMRFKTAEEIEAYPIGNGLSISDVGRVLPVKAAPQSLFRIDGSFAYYGEIQKDGQANVVETCHRLSAAIKDLEKDPALRGGFHFLPLFNQGEFIENSLAQLRDTAYTGGWLAVIVLFLFLWRVRLTLLVALSIPISVMLTIAWVFFTGGTFNVLTMTGITLAMGMLVDNSIVVIENITRLRAEGHPMSDAVVRGTSEVGLAVLLSTLTGVVVFLPLIFMSEEPVLRIMFGELGIPLCVSLVASLLVALLFLPVLAKRALGERPAFLQRTTPGLSRIGSIPARTVAWTIGGLRLGLHSFLVALLSVERSALAVLRPLRWPIAAAVCGLAAWKGFATWRLLSASDASGLVTARPEFLHLGPTGTVLLWYALPAALGCALLLLGVPRWVPVRGAKLEPPSAWVPRGTSVVDLLIDVNQHLVAWTMARRLPATLVMMLAFATVVIPASKMTMARFGEDDNKSRINIWVDLEDNFTLSESADEMAHYESFFQTKREAYRFDHIADRFNIEGGRLSVYWEAPQKADHIAWVEDDIKRSIPHLPGHKLRFLDEMQGGENRSKSVVTFRLHGPDSEELERLGAQAIQVLESVPGLSSITSPLEEGARQVRVQLDADLAQRMGVSASSALQNISWALRGVQLPRFQEPGREIPLIIEYDEAEVAGLDTLRDLQVYNGASSVPLSSFSDLSFGRSSRSIQRRNGQATFTISARVENAARQRELSDAGQRALQGIDLPRGYTIGEEDSVGQRQQQEMKELLNALLLSIILVFLLMGILFESFLLPLSVLFTIPYAILGSYWTLYLTGTAMDSVGWIGIIILIGVEVNHGIVLIDRIHQLRASGVERTAAVLEGCKNRVRPIMMTALTAVMGLYPMAVTEPAGDGIDYRALATCVAGGLIVSTVFTLWVVPLAYTLLDDLSIKVADHLRWGLRPWKRGAKAAAVLGADPRTT